MTLLEFSEIRLQAGCPKSWRSNFLHCTTSRLDSRPPTLLSSRYRGSFLQ